MGFKIFALLGSPRYGNTYQLCKLFLEELSKYVDIDPHIKRVDDYRILFCKGCLRCIVEGRSCDIADDMEMLKRDIESSDLFILASPVYILNISAQLKMVLDRACSWFHKPPFIGKYAIVIASTASSGLKQVLRMLRTAVVCWGMVCLGEIGAVFRRGEIIDREGVYRRVSRLASYTAKVLRNEVKPKPSLFDLIVFEVTKRRAMMTKHWARHEYEYWSSRNIFTKDYFSDNVSIPIYAKAIAKLVASIAMRIALR